MYRSDCVVASPTARFGLPEALRGIYAGAGGLPRLIRNTGLHIASEVAMTGRQLTAEEAKGYNLVNKISRTPESVVDEAIQMAASIAAISPDAIIVTRAALRQAWETGSVERAFEITDDRFKLPLMTGENAKEGLEAFAQKRQPNWKPSKL
jgi:enoyl-CoA hydratase/carnithine racemase